MTHVPFVTCLKTQSQHINRCWRCNKITCCLSFSSVKAHYTRYVVSNKRKFYCECKMLMRMMNLLMKKEDDKLHVHFCVSSETHPPSFVHHHSSLPFYHYHFFIIVITVISHKRACTTCPTASFLLQMIISPSQTSMHLLHPLFRIDSWCSSNQHNEKGWESITIRIRIRFLFFLTKQK